MIDEEKASPRAPRGRRLAGTPSGAGRPRAGRRGRGRARPARGPRAAGGGPPGHAAKTCTWRRRRPSSTATSIEDLQLSWSEAELPERERTKHVHRLHPYLGKFVPQLVEALLGRYVEPGGRVLDPFAGSGTTLVQALESGHDAVGVDVAAFNCLLMRVKTARYDAFLLESELRDALARRGSSRARPRGYVAEWYAPGAAAELLGFRELLERYEHADVLRVVLARAARSARLTTHFDLDFPKAPQREPYWCHKHRRTCRPVAEARKFPPLPARHARPPEGVPARAQPGHGAEVLHGDATELELHGPFAGVVTSPPYPGLIDYHEQHRYAYELSASTTVATASWAPRDAGRAGPRWPSTCQGSRRFSGSCASPSRPGRP